MNSQNRTFSCHTTPQNNPRGGVMKTRCKVTCDLEKISYTDKQKNYPQYIFCNERLDTKHENLCHVATAHVDSIFLAIFCFFSDKT